MVKQFEAQHSVSLECIYKGYNSAYIKAIIIGVRRGNVVFTSSIFLLNRFSVVWKCMNVPSTLNIMLLE